MPADYSCISIDKQEAAFVAAEMAASRRFLVVDVDQVPYHPP